MSRQTGPPCPLARDPRPRRSKQTQRPRSQQAPRRPPPSGDASCGPPSCRFVQRRFEGGLDRPRICLIPNPDNVCHKEYDSGRPGARSNRRRRFTREPMMATRDEKTTPEYEQFRELFTRRMSMRDLRPDPVPHSYVDKILEAGRWAMSGANSQPWEFIVVRDPQVKQALVDAYVDVNNDFIFGWSRCDWRNCAIPPSRCKATRPSSGSGCARGTRPGVRRQCSSSFSATAPDNGERCSAP